MSRLHCALNTNNFEASVDFYTKLFGLLPVRLEDGYAKFSSNDPSINLTLNYVSDPITHNAINHMGIEVDDSQAVYAAQKRLERLGLATNWRKALIAVTLSKIKYGCLTRMAITGNSFL